MSVEERFLEALDNEEGEVPADLSWRQRQRQEFRHKSRETVDQFLGRGRRTNVAGILPSYYGELLTWALHRYLEREGWKIVSTLGYRGPEPVYMDVSTDCGSGENLLMNGQLLIERGDSRFIVTVDVNPRWRGSVQVEGAANEKEEITAFVAGVINVAEQENIYRGKKVEFAGRIRFLNVAEKSWDSIVLDAETKAEIKANTVGFIKRGEQWNKYGIPLKRGILLAGEPGTGKTIICKALMGEASDITCITTNGYALDDDDYVTELYELAGDLSPSIVFIEDLDLIGQNRMEFGYQKGSALISLLAALDGVEEQKGIVTVATTNCLETLDKALSQRPSRFDRVIRLSRPSLEQRLELVRRLCHKIPLHQAAQEYIARRSEGCTPAQVQEIVHSLAIEHGEEAPDSGLSFSEEAIDHVISRINGRSRPLGFSISGNHGHNGLYQVLASVDCRQRGKSGVPA